MFPSSVCVCVLCADFLNSICKDKDFPSDVYKTWEEGVYFLRSRKDSRHLALAGKLRYTYDCFSLGILLYVVAVCFCKLG